MKKFTESIKNKVEKLEHSNKKKELKEIEHLIAGFEEDDIDISNHLRKIHDLLDLIDKHEVKAKEYDQREQTEEIDLWVKEIHDEMQKLWTEKSLESITKEEMEAVKKLKTIQREVSDNLYMQQLLSIITALRDVIGQAKAIKLQKKKL